MTKKTSLKKHPLTLHALLGALSYWGTAARTILFSVLAVTVFIIALSEVTGRGIDNEVMTLIYVLGSFVLLDAGYVIIARSYMLPKIFDILAIYVAEIILGMLYMVPKIVVSSSVALKTHPLLYVIFIPIIVLSIRLLIGILFGKQRR